MAFRLEEKRRNVDTLQHVVAKQNKKRVIRSVLRKNIRSVILPRRILLIKFVLNRFCQIWCAILVGRRTCWHRQRPRDRIQFGEAAVPVQQVELVFSVEKRKIVSFG